MMTEISLTASGSIDEDNSIAEFDLFVQSPALSDPKTRRRLSSKAISLMDDPEEEEDLEESLNTMESREDSDLTEKANIRLAGQLEAPIYSSIAEPPDVSSVSLYRFTEGMSELLCPATLETADLLAASGGLHDHSRNASETEILQNHAYSGLCGSSTGPSSPGNVLAGDEQYNMSQSTQIDVTKCVDLNLEGIRQLVEADVSAMLGSTSTTANQWLSIAFPACLDPALTSPRANPLTSRREIRNRCGFRTAQAQRWQQLWHKWHSDTGGAAVREIPQQSSMPPFISWGLSVTKSLDDADRTIYSEAPSLLGPELTFASETSKTPSNSAELYYDSDPEIFRHATSIAQAESPGRKPMRHRRQVKIPAPIQTVVSVASGEVECPLTPRNSTGKGAPSFDIESFDTRDDPPPEETRRHEIDLGDDELVRQCVKELSFSKTNLVWHPSPSDMKGAASGETKSRSPVSVQVWVEMGSRLPNALIQPKLMWRETYKPDPLNHKRLGTLCQKPNSLDLLSMIRILKPTSLDRTLYPFAKLDHTFTILTHQKQLYVFEASCFQERDRMVRGLKLLVARLASMIIVEDEIMFAEFFSPLAHSPMLEHNSKIETREATCNDGKEESAVSSWFASTTDKQRAQLWGTRGIP